MTYSMTHTTRDGIEVNTWEYHKLHTKLVHQLSKISDVLDRLGSAPSEMVITEMADIYDDMPHHAVVTRELMDDIAHRERVSE